MRKKNLLPFISCFLLATAFQNSAFSQVKGPSSSQTPYLLPAAPGVQVTSILTTSDIIGGYKMCGTPDGTGAFDNGNGTFTLIVNHEFGNTAGVTRAHGSIGAFVSKWVINKSNLSVVSGSDLIQNVKLWNGSSYTTYNAANPSTLTRFNRLCSADLPVVSAFYNNASGKGTTERIFMNGEEAGSEGRAFAHIITGANAGTSYELPYLGKFSWENSVANAATGDKTVVAGTDDATPGQVYFYIGTKTNTGTEIEKAGLSNGVLYSPSVSGMLLETSGSIPALNTPFTMINLGDVHNLTGSTLNTNSNNAGVTQFLRPEDGGWDPLHPEDFYFVTTNAFASPSRLWRLHFNNLNDLTQGGTITAMLDGTEGQKMFDNITIDHWGHILLQEDVGNNAHNGKIWQYTIATDELKLIAKHDPARFGDIGMAASSPYNQDEESSGIIDVQEILGAGMFLMVDQAHYPIAGDAVEGGQLLALYNPDTYNSCSDYSGVISVSPSPVLTNQLANTIYFGYGPQSVTLTASVPVGFSPYTYSWSQGAATINAITVSPTATTTYTVTIKNAFGCAITVSQTITVKDIRDGEKNKVFICHNGNSISVSVNAVPAHLAHGDLLGNCEAGSTITKAEAAIENKIQNIIAIYPNPANNGAYLSVNPVNDEQVSISVYDLNGKKVLQPVYRNLKAGNQIIELNTERLKNGIYYVQLSGSVSKATLKLIVLH